LRKNALRLVYDPAADGSNIKCNSTRDDGDGSNSNSNSNSSLLSASTRLLGPLGLTYACQPHPSEPCWPGSSDTICDDSFGTGTFFLIGNPGRLFTGDSSGVQTNNMLSEGIKDSPTTGIER